MKIIFSCHTEYDLKNKGEKQTFYHVFPLLKFIKSLRIPVTFSLMVGGAVGDNLLKFIKEKNIQIPVACEESIHYHEDEKRLSEREIINYFKIFQKILHKKPASVVFGKWIIHKEHFPVLQKLGIRADGSWTGKMSEERFIIKAPFYFNNILEVPVVCDGEKPANPFTRLSNFFLIRKIIKEHYQENFILHIGFHSYDFFRFNKKPKPRLIKKIIFKNILKLAQKYKVEIINLSAIKTTNFQDLKSLKISIFIKLLRCLGH